MNKKTTSDVSLLCLSSFFERFAVTSADQSAMDPHTTLPSPSISRVSSFGIVKDRSRDCDSFIFILNSLAKTNYSQSKLQFGNCWFTVVTSLLRPLPTGDI